MKKTWSYWERGMYPKENDLLIIGAGFTGLSAAIHAKQLHPEWKVLLVERDAIAEGASTKNAGFACYGTIGEIQSDIELMGRDAALELVQKRWEGLNFLKTLVSIESIQFEAHGGTEIFLKGEEGAYASAITNMDRINAYFQKAGISEELFKVSAHFTRFDTGIGSINSGEEAQLNPMKALWELDLKARALGVTILRNTELIEVEPRSAGWKIITNKGDWLANQVLFCTNAFGFPGHQLDIIPARNQVLITKPFNHDLPLGNYHAQEGFLYFRTVGNRILIGGARHLAENEESTDQFGPNPYLLNHLKAFLDQELGLTGSWEMDQSWSGIIASGKAKDPLLLEVEPGLWYCGRFGGMGVALSAQKGREAAQVIRG